MTSALTHKRELQVELDRLYYRVPEACYLLGGIHRHTLYKWIAKGRLTPVKIDRVTLIARTELERLAHHLAHHGNGGADRPQSTRNYRRRQPKAGNTGV